MVTLGAFLAFILSLFHSNSRLDIDTNSFNVLDYGAIGDGFSDDTKAFEDVWRDTCNYMGSQATFKIPEGKTFLLQPIEFHGPCKSQKIVFSINGNLTAPEAPHKWECKNDRCHKWIEFAHVDGLHINGHGIFDGQGSKWWSLDCNIYKNACLGRPRGMVISHSSNVHISNILVKDSPNFQMSLEDSKWVHVKKITITADGESPNTDGIHIQRSQNVVISNSNIRTGDDCISIGDGSRYINISRISCGPGHGISIGSLGRHGTTETVEDVVVKDCIFRETSNGVRIKTWQGGKGHVRNVLFERIKFYRATRPIIIDQYYCPHSRCNNYTEAVEISNVRYKHIHGTSTKKPYVQLLCSESVPCRNIFMSDINIYDEKEENKYKKSSSHEHPSAQCINVEGISNGLVKPKLSCLSS